MLAWGQIRPTVGDFGAAFTALLVAGLVLVLLVFAAAPYLRALPRPGGRRPGTDGGQR